MTQAVCINCGEIKWGAFNPCQKCKKEPKDEDDLALSLALSDHHFSFKELKSIGKRINRGMMFWEYYCLIGTEIGS